MSSPRSTTPLSNAAIEFIEDFGRLVSEAGLPRSFGRVFGFLLICQPEQQSAEDIQKRLKLSAGSVSTATSILSRQGFIKRLTYPGSRRLYYQFEADSWTRIIEERMRQIKWAKELAESGMKISQKDPRLEGMYQLYSKLEVAIGQIKF